MGTQTYLVALGSNVTGRWGTPRRLLDHVLAAFEPGPIRILATSRIHASAPLGPGTRTYANAVALIASDLTPPDLLTHLKAIERMYGRRAGRRWGDRVLDLDIIGWSGGRFWSPTLRIPHAAFRTRRFVLVPLVEIAPTWRDPVTRRTSRQLLARLDRRRPEYFEALVNPFRIPVFH